MQFQMTPTIHATGTVYMLVYLPGKGGKDGELLAPEHGCRWPARSGPYGKGAAPPGTYKVGVPTRLNDDATEAFKDTNGFAWWVPLTPAFETERTGLGIHPDGNVEGTLGCIGIALPDTSGVYGKLKEIVVDPGTYLIVM